jgi:hypothetical protein
MYTMAVPPAEQSVSFYFLIGVGVYFHHGWHHQREAVEVSIGDTCLASSPMLHANRPVPCPMVGSSRHCVVVSRMTADVFLTCRR